MSGDFSLFDGAVWYLVFLFSTTVHEASHAFVAWQLGDDTAHRGGQVTLDPFPHIKREPIGTVVVPIASFLTGGWMLGWASAPYDLRWAARYPRRLAWMSLAGPAANFVLLLLSAFAIRLGILVGWFELPPTVTIARTVEWTRDGIPHLAGALIGTCFLLNLILFVFNLLPLPPLDGRNIPLLLLPPELARKFAEFMREPGLRLVGLIAAWWIFGKLFAPLHHFAIKVLYPDAHYVFSAFSPFSAG